MMNTWDMNSVIKQIKERFDKNMNMVYKHFSFVSKNKDLKYIEKDLEAFGYKNTGRASLHSYEDSIYVNAGEEDWEVLNPKVFGILIKHLKLKMNVDLKLV